MEIIISGYGRMGKEIEKICYNRNHNIVAILDSVKDWEKLDAKNNSAAIIIDFSLPEEAINNYLKCFKLGLPIVTGTTGWYDKFDFITEQCAINNGTLFYAPNFSIGVNLFFKVNEYLAKLMTGFNNYKAHINETHHIHKLDAPSGTAIAVADGILKHNSSYDNWSLNKKDNLDSLPVFSHRKGEVTGNHEVVYESNEDILSIVHQAKNRSGFALGAVLAAEFVAGKHGIFNMDDFLNHTL
jgi:4-hydroxy-tetrahydrodipicolinate reductase